MVVLWLVGQVCNWGLAVRSSRVTVTSPHPSAPKHLILVWCLSPRSSPDTGMEAPVEGSPRVPGFGGCQSRGCVCWMFLAPAGEPGGRSLHTDLQSVFWVLGSGGAAGTSHLGWAWGWQPLRNAGQHLLSCSSEDMETMWPAPRWIRCFWKYVGMIVGVFYAISPNWKQPTVHQHL